MPPPSPLPVPPPFPPLESEPIIFNPSVHALEGYEWNVLLAVPQHISIRIYHRPIGSEGRLDAGDKVTYVPANLVTGESCPADSYTVDGAGNGEDHGGTLQLDENGIPFVDVNLHDLDGNASQPGNVDYEFCYRRAATNARRRSRWLQTDDESQWSRGGGFLIVFTPLGPHPIILPPGQRDRLYLWGVLALVGSVLALCLAVAFLLYVGRELVKQRAAPVKPEEIPALPAPQPLPTPEVDGTLFCGPTIGIALTNPGAAPCVHRAPPLMPATGTCSYA